jgi:signal transduction histidine kinase/DNA-binding response OmpR family regulator/HPt (histidine-containing phosphotransfer) domain-containing protein
MMDNQTWLEYVKTHSYNNAYMIDKNGDEKIFEIRTSGKIFEEEDEDEIGEEVVVLTDITDLKHALDEVKEQQKHKDQFLANMSHEIRTPINGIMGFTTILKEIASTSEQKEYIDIIEKSSNLLLTIVNDILDYSKVQSGKLELEYIPANIKDDLNMVTKLFAKRVEDKGVKFVVDIDEKIPYCLECDINRLKQVLINLLGNALKFTSKGSVTIRVNLLSHIDNIAKVRFGVKDTGIGIPKDKQDKIFESFSQADVSTTRKFGGTGLGLSIAKHIVELAGGEMLLESKEGVGSEFYFELEMKTCNNIVNDIDDLTFLYNKYEGKKILVAEDNEINQKLISKLLSQRDIEFEIAPNGKKAVYKYVKTQTDDEVQNYDLILMDISMPVMGGMDATKEIILFENVRHIQHTPIVALTANALPSDKMRYISIGMDDYLSKPIDNKLLGKILNKYLSGGISIFDIANSSDSQKNNEVGEDAGEEVKEVEEVEKDGKMKEVEEKEGKMKEIQEVKQEIPKIAYDKVQAAKKMGVPVKFFEELIDMFYDGIGEKIDGLNKAIKEQDYSEIEHISHALKGISANVQFDKIYELTSEAEISAREQKEFDYDNYLIELKKLVEGYRP